jgi:hypothetical protein
LTGYRRADKRQLNRLTLLSLAAILSIIVLVLAYPRFSSSLSYIPVEAALDRHWKDYPIKQSQYPVLIGIANKAIKKHDLARYWQGLGWLYYLQATSTPAGADAEQTRQSLQLAQAAFETFLKRSPANPAAWLRLAWIHTLLNDQAEWVVNSLTMSFYSGRAERYLILNRLDLALRYADYFDDEQLSLLRDQIQLAWRLLEKDMLKFIRSGVLDQQTLLELIADSNPELAQEIQLKL